MKSQIGLSFILLFSSITVFAGSVEKYNKVLKVNDNRKCFRSGTCGLKKAELYAYDYKADFGDGSPSFGTTLYYRYDTKRVSQLEDYVVVQFIKGCSFSSQLVDGKIVRSMSRAREFFGEIVPFMHKNWVVDSVDTDPAYNNGQELRHGPYRWNRKKGTYQRNTEVRYRSEQPVAKPHLYVRDLPSTAFYEASTKEAQNVSLKFKTCMFKSKEVPRDSTPNELKPEDGLFCMEWDSSFIFNHARKKFERKTRIDQYCL